MIKSPRTSEEGKSVLCLSPHEKLSTVRHKRSQPSKSSAIGGDDRDVHTKKTKQQKVRHEEGSYKVQQDRDVVALHGTRDGMGADIAVAVSASDDYYARAMDFDDSLNQDIDWVDHNEMDLTLSMDALAQEDPHHHDGTDFGFHPSFLRGSGLEFEDSAEMASTFVDPVYIRLESSTNAKDAEKLLMSFDTMNFTIPSPTSASSRKRVGLFVVEKEAENVQEDTLTRRTSTAVDTKAAAASCSQTAKSTPAKSEEPQTQQVQGSAASSCTSSLSVSSSVDPVLSVLNIETTAPSSSALGKKIGAYSPAARKLRLQKFHEKRKNRTWKKSIKYDCRKKLADDRPRIKGRFVRVGLETSSDTKADVVPSSTASASIEYPFSTSAVDAMASPAMPPAHTIKSHVTPSSLSSLASAAKQASASVAKSASVAAPVTSAAAVATTAAAAALPFARMIASV
ncbi:unnamed protein product [Hyaloperonospora brassicae]|uniref:CCT domain-containing protein n=1 Tax=Hyaloperonospora brassicae TaxID=162125 RepID=A0AAV0TQZ6_HYABA|nr:unnamed protein product [Hyaloperonospora brassicae]